MPLGPGSRPDANELVAPLESGARGDVWPVGVLIAALLGLMAAALGAAAPLRDLEGHYEYREGATLLSKQQGETRTWQMTASACPRARSTC
jgi:hypothetical protein